MAIPPDLGDSVYLVRFDRKGFSEAARRVSGVALVEGSQYDRVELSGDVIYGALVEGGVQPVVNVV